MFYGPKFAHFTSLLASIYDDHKASIHERHLDHSQLQPFCDLAVLNEQAASPFFFGHVQTELDTELGGLFFLYGNYSTSTSIRKPPAMVSMRRKPEERTAWGKKIERPRVRGRVDRPREGGGARTREVGSGMV